MAQLTFNQKAHRVVTFLMGARYPRIAQRLHERGFELEDWEEGWALLRRSAASNAAIDETVDTTRLLAVEELERRWIPTIDATLLARFPLVHARVFARCERVSGPAVIFMMRAISRRLHAMVESEDPEDRQAASLLARRGVTGETLAAIDAALEHVTTVPDPGPPGAPVEERTLAQEALWRWFLEWSRIARSAIADRRSLRRLGFLHSGRGVADAADEPATPPPGLPAPE